MLRLTNVTVCRFCLGGCLSPLFGEGTKSIGFETLQLRLCRDRRCVGAVLLEKLTVGARIVFRGLSCMYIPSLNVAVPMPCGSHGCNVL